MLAIISQQIDNVLQLEIPDDTYFNRFGIYSNYHGGGNILFEESVNIKLDSFS